MARSLRVPLRSVGRCGCVLTAALILLSSPPPASAQFAVGGVFVDPEGMLRHASALAPDERLERLRNAAIGSPSSEVSQGSTVRKVSLARLERAVADSHAAGQPLTADVRHVAGMTAVRYVFFDPAAGDVILAGPAEGWTVAETGEVVGTQTGRPVLHLDDLIVALRFACAENPADGFIGCSIDPTAEGVRENAAYMRRLGAIDRGRIPQIFAGMEQAMGPQAIRLFGVDPSSRAATTLVAADYRLKRLALGHDPSPVREVVNYLDLAARRFNRRAAQKQHRWWFVGHYDAVYHTPDELAFEFDGPGLRVATARTVPGSGAGNTSEDGNDPPSPAAVEFAESLTRHLPAVAEKLPVFLELQNLVGLAAVAELIARRGGSEASAPAGGRSGTPSYVAATTEATWQPEHFLDEQQCPLQAYPSPQAVPSLANYRFVQGRHWLISISGGVEIQPGELVGRRHRRQTTERGLSELQAQVRTPGDEERWWWD